MRQNTFILSIITVSLFLPVASFADDTTAPDAESVAKSDVNPGLKFLDDAMDKKLKANEISELDAVVDLCEKAKNEGLTGENLDFCNQLLSATRLQRGMHNGTNIMGLIQGGSSPDTWKKNKDLALQDLKAALESNPKQPQAYLMSAQLMMLDVVDDNADVNAAKVKEINELLTKAIDNGQDVPEIQTRAMLFKVRFEKDTAKREELLKKAAELSADAPEILFLQALNFQEIGKYDEAIEVASKMQEMNPDDQRAIGLILNLCVAQKKFDKAIQIIDAMLKNSPDNAELSQQKIQLLMMNKKFDEAADLIDNLLKKKPDNLELLFQKSQLLTVTKKYDDAIKIIDAMIKIAPDNDNLLIRKSFVLDIAKRYDECVELLNDVLKKEPENLFVLRLLTAAYTNQKKFDKALETADKILEIEKSDETITLKAMVLVSAKRFDDAVKLLDESKDVYESEADIKLTKATIYLEQKKSKKAYVLVKEVVDADENNIKALKMYANTLLNIGKHQEAKEVFEKIVKKTPDDEVMLNNLSWLLSTSPDDKLRDGKRALELALKACELSNFGEAYILSTLAAAYAELGDFDKALEWSQKSVDLSEKEDDEERIEALKKELESYKNKKPVRELITEESDEE
ncbi:MAG: tetratricopeptide repeat protein [Planctomycetaceae bacterium]|jgi:tetratricopeptide (TPR) repeat protein|nr:tetratricopeptide repeat protein [Planctomycetaceae bacterium]